MRFEDFAAEHGLIVRHVEYGAWRRVPTVDHPAKKNGAYRHLGEFAFVQNHATMSEVATWHADASLGMMLSREVVARRLAKAEEDRDRHRVNAALDAAAAIKSCSVGTHPYLEAKGLPAARVLVTEDGTLIVPMRDCATGAILGMQKIALIDNEWHKKMAFGMRAKYAVHVIGNSHANELWLVEGFATGLSVAEALRLLRIPASVVVCFSDGNLVAVANRLRGNRFVFADNDASGAGEAAARKTGLPYAMADRPSGIKSMDANDLHQASGIMAVAKLIMEARSR